MENWIHSLPLAVASVASVTTVSVSTDFDRLSFCLSFTSSSAFKSSSCGVDWLRSAVADGRSPPPPPSANFALIIFLSPLSSITSIGSSNSSPFISISALSKRSVVSVLLRCVFPLPLSLFWQRNLGKVSRSLLCAGTVQSGTAATATAAGVHHHFNPSQSSVVRANGRLRMLASGARRLAHTRTYTFPY